MHDICDIQIWWQPSDRSVDSIGEWTADCEHSLSPINPIQELGHLGTPYIDPM